MKGLTRWLIGDIIMFSSYLVLIYGSFTGPTWFKWIVGIALPIGFFFHIKQDYDILSNTVRTKEVKANVISR